MTEPAEYIVGCNGAEIKSRGKNAHYFELEYRREYPNRNVDLRFDCLLKNDNVSPRLKDLLEIAGYVFAVDIKSNRERTNGSGSHPGNRLFHFHINVRDYSFWNQIEVKKLLEQSLCFMTGDIGFRFSFYKAGPDNSSSGPEDISFKIIPSEKLNVTLFSGGLDSAAGVIDLLESSYNMICLVSHQSGPPGVTKTQNNLYSRLSELYPVRCTHFKFHCGLLKDHSTDKTQHTRAFLYNTASFVIARLYDQHCSYVYENGITSINFNESHTPMDTIAGRSTHPKTLGLLEDLFTLISGKQFRIQQPFLFKTKTEVIEVLQKYDRLALMKSAVSCNRVRDVLPGYTHCGICPECINRLFALHASEAVKYHSKNIYYSDFLSGELSDSELIESLLVIIKQAQNFSRQNIDSFYRQWEDELIEIEEYYEGNSYGEILEKIYRLCQNHAKNIKKAIDRMRDIYDSPWSEYNPRSFFSLIVNRRIYQQEAPVSEICEIVNHYGSGDIIQEETKLPGIPVRGLKKLLKEKCRELIEKSIITEPLTESKHSKKISGIIIPELQKKYTLTPGNKATISDYFRKGELIISKKNGKLTVIDTYPRSN